MASTKLRVAVIGAGAAGLCAARHLLASPDTFAPPVVFEGSSRLGGTWVYTEETGEDAWGWTIHSSMYHDLRTNLPKEVMAFPDFPFDPSLPSFLHHSDVLSYLESYAEHFGIQDNIRFHWQVEEVRPGQKGQTGSPCGWDVTAVLRAPDSAQRVTEHFDAVLVCTGHYASPFLPAIPGLDSFQGKGWIPATKKERGAMFPPWPVSPRRAISLPPPPPHGCSQGGCHTKRPVGG
uniref:Flavin-containing monooxygenase n=1 Tax=Varanus komodoensis TaxID=61221 RepID=A0A8D2LMQ3_VARKO